MVKQLNRLRELRENEDISLARLCKTLKREHNISVSPSQLLYYETGEREPRNKEIWEELAKHFNVSVSYLLGYSDKKEPYYSDEILIGDGQGGYTSLSSERENELSELYFEHLEEEFVKFLKRYDFVISDNEIKAVLNHISNLNINTYRSDEYNQLVDLVMEEKIDLKKIGYSKLGDNFHSWKGFDDFKKSLGYDTDHIL